MPQVLPRDHATRWRVSYTVRGKTTAPLASYARITLQHGSTRWRFRSATRDAGRRDDVAVRGARAALVSGRPRDLKVEAHLTVRGQDEEFVSRSYDVRVR